MELILISETKLKIMLSADDMKLYDIDCDTIDYDDKISRRAFWDILSEARERTGFDASSDKVFVQVYPSKEGGCEMFVTKINSHNTKGRSFEPYDEQRPVRKNMKKCIYQFDSMDSLISSCCAMKSSGFSGVSLAYAEPEAKRYYLVTESETYIPSEFFGRQCKIHSLFYIGEHCKCISDNAVSVLGSLA